MAMRRATMLIGAVVLAAGLVGCGGPSATTPTSTPGMAATTTTGTSTAPAGATAAATATATTPPITPAATSTPPASPVAASALTIDGTRVVQVAVAGPSQNLVYAATASGLYRRSGSGAWALVSSRPVTGQLLVDPSNSDVLYQGDHAPCARGGATVAFQKSVDGGKTWQMLPGGQDVRPWVVDPANPARIYGDKCQLAISTDGGQSWTTSPVVPSFDVSSMALTGSTLEVIATSEGGTSRLVPVDVSTPGRAVAGTTQLEFWGGGAVVASGGRLVVGEPRGVHVSTDGGRTWSFSRAGLEKVTVSVDVLSTPLPQSEISQGFGIFALAADPVRPDTMFAGTIHGLYRSADGGKTWQPVGAIAPVRVRTLAMASDGAQLYVTTDEGVTLLTNP
ncbi:MAG TPA: hypothetical protein VFN57_14335 [Thermomicrobiaceae bacterium]|nr:hypothetical protein [Thermomicrobiaceae bacterium]